MNSSDKTSSVSQGLLWFGAAVSIAEILTGALLAPLGFAQAVLAILIGHAIGGVIFYLAGYIGARGGFSAIESTGISFGRYGARFFSVLNVVQLLGWTAVMVINGAKALNAVTPAIQSEAVWCLVIGGLICIWILVGIKNLAKVNAFVVSALFALMLLLGFVVFRGTSGAQPAAGVLSFGAAVELSVTMPLSWLPLISDYTRTAKHPKAGCAMSATGYTLGSCMMYIIGLGAALNAGSDDIAAILAAAGLGIAAALIVVLSTVTTTFLDAWSGGVSLTLLTNKISEKGAALIVCIVGTALAILVPNSQYENFLYLIGSVFAPLFAVLITDYFVLGVRERKTTALDVKNGVIWILGFAFYRLMLHVDIVAGVTLPTMLFVALVCILASKLAGKQRI